jgi:hypothetical protein
MLRLFRIVRRKKPRFGCRQGGADAFEDTNREHENYSAAEN